MSETKGIRIAKFIADAQVASRRQAEKLIAEGKVKLNGKVVATPATLVTDEDKIEVMNRHIRRSKSVELYLFYKPKGILTTAYDDRGRPTIYDVLPKKYHHLKYVGRLDFNTEGLLLLTNNGELARALELPKNNVERTYRVRVFGKLTPEIIEAIKKGPTVEGINYRACKLVVENAKSAGEHKNQWVRMTLKEGKNREIRKIFSHFDLEVNKLLRTAFAGFELGMLQPGKIERVPDDIISILVEKYLK